MHSRWTAVCGKMLLKPGDWVRTDNRGANAATLKIVKQSQITLGPGSLVELVSPTQVRIHSGEFEVSVGDKDALELVGPGEERLAAIVTRDSMIELPFEATNRSSMRTGSARSSA